MNSIVSNPPKQARGKPYIKGDARCGRRPGSLNKTTQILKEAYQKAFASLQDHPEHSLKAWAEKEPAEFYRIASKIIPDQVSQLLKNTIKIQ